MPHKVVYGKRKAKVNVSFLSPLKPTWSSPQKPEHLKHVTKKTTKEVVSQAGDLDDAFRSLHISSVSTNKATIDEEAPTVKEQGISSISNSDEDEATSSFGSDSQLSGPRTAETSTSNTPSSTPASHRSQSNEQPNNTSSLNPSALSATKLAKQDIHPPPTLPLTNPCTTHLSPLLSLADSPRRHLLPFATWFSPYRAHFHLSKLAEASFGEVYRLSLKRSHPGLTRADESVLKLIALKPPAVVQESWGYLPAARRREMRETAKGMTAVRDVVSEVRLLQLMAAVPGFTVFRDVAVLQGRPCREFVDAWRAWDREQPEGKKSIFPDPGREGGVDEEQLWAVVEMQDAGTDLESVMLGEGKGKNAEELQKAVTSVFGVWDVFWSVAISLAKAEQVMEFEHRDLHEGNICIRFTRDDIISPVVDEARNLGFTGIETTIIDYTLSRALLDDSTAREDGTAYLDLEADMSLFKAKGNYQYDIYRYMRASLFSDGPLAKQPTQRDVKKALAEGKSWKDHHPRTNVLWLQHLLIKLIACMTKGSLQSKQHSPKKLQIERQLERLSTMSKKEFFAFSSATAFVEWALAEALFTLKDIRNMVS